MAVDHKDEQAVYFAHCRKPLVWYDPRDMALAILDRNYVLCHSCMNILRDLDKLK